MIAIRRARAADAPGIGAVHVAAWRSAYPGLLPDRLLAKLSAPRQAAHYDAAIRARVPVHVAMASGADLPTLSAPRVVGFTTGGPARAAPGGGMLAEAEVETLYVLDDWRERGLGRRLMRAAATELAGLGYRSLLVWVLRDNPARWFYAHIGGKPVAERTILVGGRRVAQTAFVWDPIAPLLDGPPRPPGAEGNF
ncbi:MAG: GNAT family N-acetyltransferase [Rhodospirillales bacterium]|nr:GNAT family N-acetyltransferase [Rhodospirillales bacterium]